MQKSVPSPLLFFVPALVWSQDDVISPNVVRRAGSFCMATISYTTSSKRMGKIEKTETF
jgi:hypothetical protein